ncbi:phage tail protein [Providencia hangzhouensis]|uniref:phage tail-collar fiber domain-containing protein n=4 Tax=Providencia hangzhouensis TaxID=3031799 RepID=UPI0030D3F8C8
MTPFYTILTNDGKTALAEALAAQLPLEIPHMAVGDGGGAYYDPVEAQTNLRNELWRGDLNDLRTDANVQGQVIAEAIIPMGIEGDWTVREIGLFDAKGRLIAVGKYPETYIPSVLSGAKSQVHISIIINVDNVAAVQLIVDHGQVLASKLYVNERGYGSVGSFERGLFHITQLTTSLQWVLFEKENTLYHWTGEFPKVVTKNSTPLSSGGIGAGKWQAINQNSRAEVNNFILKFYAIADYKGAPVYDGNDSTRITATDNSPALLRAFSDGDVINGVLTINIPAGHYGFKTELGNISLRPDVEKVVFVGSGREETILDFIYEDLTSRKNPSPLEAHKLFMLTGLQKVTFVNMTVKCTTKHGAVDGSTNPSPDNPSVYYGTVWFAHLQDCHSVRFENTDATRGNYRCVSVSGSGMPVGFRTKVSLVNCNGYYNTSTGFWLDHCGSLQVMGGEYYRNGTVGLLATGYGIAASQYVDDIFVANAKFYENYRKGFDRHGGVGSFVISNCTFADNILRDIEDIKQYSGEYPTDKVNFNSISNCNFYLNANKPFLAEALSAVNNHPSTLKCFISSVEGALIPSNLRQEQLDIVSCNVKVFGNIPVGYQGFNGFNTAAKTTILSNCDIDTTGFLIDADVTGDVYSSYMFALMRDDGAISFSNTKVKAHPGRIISSINGQPSNSIFILTGANAQVTANNLTAELTNFVLMGTSGSGGAYQSDAVRDFTSSTFIFRNAQLYTHNQQTTNALTWLTNGFGFQPVTKQPKINNCLIGLGDANTLYEYSNHKNSLNTSTFKINGGDRKKDEKDYLFTGFINGDFNVELTGRSELFNDKNSTTFRYSTKEKVEYLASNYLSVTYYGEAPITHKGGNTNFIAIIIGIGWKQNSRGSIGWYDGVVTARTNEIGVIN